MIDSLQIQIGPAAGAAGAAQAEALSLPIAGQILAVRILPGAGVPTSTRLRLLCESFGALDAFIYIQGASIETIIYPRRLLQSPTGEAWEYSTDHPVVGCYTAHGPIRAELTHTNPGATATCTILYEAG